MNGLHRIRRACSGLVVAVMLWTATMPALALALKGPPGNPDSWVEVCTGRGTLVLKRVVFDAAQATTNGDIIPSVPRQTDNGLASSLTHCPYCPTGGLDTAIPGATYGWLVVASVSVAIPLAHRTKPATTVRWTLPPGNGPPRTNA